MTNEQIHQLCRKLIGVAAEYGKIETPACMQVSSLCRQAANILTDLKWKVQKYEHVLRFLDQIDAPGAGAVLKEDWGTQEWWAKRTDPTAATDKDSMTVGDATTEQSSADHISGVTEMMVVAEPVAAVGAAPAAPTTDQADDSGTT